MSTCAHTIEALERASSRDRQGPTLCLWRKSSYIARIVDVDLDELMKVTQYGETDDGSLKFLGR